MLPWGLVVVMWGEGRGGLFITVVWLTIFCFSVDPSYAEVVKRAITENRSVRIFINYLFLPFHLHFPVINLGILNCRLLVGAFC